MKLSEAIEVYVHSRRLDGAAYNQGEIVLRSFCRHTGNVQLEHLSVHQAITFLNGPRTSPRTWKNKHGFLHRFIQYCSFREMMPPLVLPPSPKCDLSFCPYIYSTSEIRTLLAMTQHCQRGSRTIDAATLRILVLTLYATGALVSEVLGLRRMDIDLRRGYVIFGANEQRRRRRVPINADLRKELAAFVQLSCEQVGSETLIFRAISGSPINRFNLNERFRKLRRMAGVLRHDGIRYEPRMQDFRATFAVHRLSSWIERGTNLSRMLPSLSAYMGYSGLAATEKYLSLTPERFRKELAKLSPQSECKHWRGDADLMAFLARLQT